MSRSAFEKLHWKILKSVAKDSREISGGKIKPHLRVATKSHANQELRRQLRNQGKDAPFSSLAKTWEREKEPEIDSVADELLLYMDNDQPSYRQMEAVKKMLAKKVRSGKYNHDLAPTAWRHSTDFGSERYTKEIGKEGIFPKHRGLGKQAFSTNVRDQVAKYLTWRFMNYAQSGEFDGDL
jgi:hypothetical protein